MCFCVIYALDACDLYPCFPCNAEQAKGSINVTSADVEYKGV